MNGRIPDCRHPEITGGVLCWSEGDIFELNLKMRLFSLGVELIDLTGYTLEALFFDAGGGGVHTFTSEGDGSCVFTLDFTSSVSAKFPAGKYFYDVRVSEPDGRRTCVVRRAPASVR